MGSFILLLFSGLFGLWGFFAYVKTLSAIQESTALLLMLISSLFFVGALVNDKLSQLLKIAKTTNRQDNHSLPF